MLKDSACGIRELRKRLTDVAAVIGPNFSQSPCWLSNRKPDQFVLKIFEILLRMSAIEFVCDSVNDPGSIRTKRHQESPERAVHFGQVSATWLAPAGGRNPPGRAVTIGYPSPRVACRFGINRRWSDAWSWEVTRGGNGCCSKGRS